MKKIAIILATLALLSATAYAALNNDNKTIHMVDVQDNNRLVLHFNETLDSRPSCSNFSKIAACDLNDQWCQEVVRIALAAQLSGRTVEFSLSGTCLGTVAEFNRFRVK